MSSTFARTVYVGNAAMRDQTPFELRNLQNVYRQEQIRQLEQLLQQKKLNPDDIEFYAADYEKNQCPSTGFENESGILYNKRTGVSVPVVLEWACEWNCGPEQWKHEAPIGLHTCLPQYFFVGLNEDTAQELR